MANVEVLSLATISRTFPEITSAVRRDHVLDSIEDVFEELASDVVCVVGGEGAGKTTLLAQLVERYPREAISIFVRGSSKLAYDPLLVQFDLCNQIHWLITGCELDHFTVADSALLRSKINELQRHSKKQDRLVYFVVDGLHEIPSRDSYIRDSLVEMLPVGFSRFRFVVSGALEQTGFQVYPKLKAHDVRVVPFALDESHRFFANSGVDSDEIDRVHRFCRGNPGKMATFRRLLTRGTSVDAILHEGKTRTTDLFQLEWKAVERLTPELRLALSVVAFAQFACTPFDVARIAGVSEQTVATMVEDLSFLERLQSGVIGFASEGCRNYARERLGDLRSAATEKIISHLLESPDSDKSLVTLPGQLEQAGKTDLLLQYLTPSRFERVVARTATISAVRKQIEIGLGAATRHNRPDALAAMAIEGAVALEFGYAVPFRQEVEALVVVGNVNAAIELALQAFLREDRLHLLCIIGRAAATANQPQDPTLVEQVRLLADQVDPANLGARAAEIAADLVFVDTNLAIRFVESITKDDLAAESVDWQTAATALAHATTYVGDNTAEPRPRGDAASTGAKQAMETLTRGLGVMFGRFRGEEIIAESRKQERPRNRLYILENWIDENPDDRAIVEVITEALDVAVAMVDDMPTATNFRRIAAPLASQPATQATIALCGRLRGQLPLLVVAGPIVDCFRLELALTNIEMQGGRQLNDIVPDLLARADKIRDVTARAAVYAWMLAEMESGVRAADWQSYREHIEPPFRTSIECIRLSVSEQSSALRPTLRALATVDASYMSKICASLYTRMNRDQARRSLLTAWLSARRNNKPDPAVVIDLLHEFENYESRSSAVAYALNSLADGEQSAGITDIEKLQRLVATVSSPSERAEALAKLIAMVAAGGLWASGQFQTLFGDLYETWSAIDDDALRVVSSFEIARALAAYAPAEAIEYVSLGDGARRRSGEQDALRLSGMFVAINICVRALGALLDSNIDTTADVEEVFELIDQMPGEFYRLHLRSAVVLRLHAAGCLDRAAEVVSKYIIPAIVSHERSDPHTQADLIVDAAAAMYVVHPAAALSYISGVSDPMRRDDAYARIIKHLRTHVPFGDPVRARGIARSLEWSDIVAILDLVARIQVDALLFGTISLLVDAVDSRLRDYTPSQLAEVSARIDAIAAQRGPSVDGVDHNGYKIVLRAAAIRLGRSKAQDWLDIVQEALDVPNAADRAFILGRVFVGIPRKFESVRDRAFTEFKAASANIAAFGNRIGHICGFVSTLSAKDAVLAKELMRELVDLIAADATIDSSLGDQIVDTACGLGEEFAGAYAKTVGALRARPDLRRRMNRRFEFYNKKRRLLTSESENDLESFDDAEVARAAAMTLGDLHGGQFEHCHPAALKRFLARAGRMRIVDAYPAFALYLESERRRLRRSSNAARELRPVFEAVLEAARFVCAISRKPGVITQPRIQVRRDSSESVLIHIGERERAVAYLQEWVGARKSAYLKIADGYLDADQLRLVRALVSARTDVNVCILTGRGNASSSQLEDSFRNTWAQLPVLSGCRIEVVIVTDGLGGGSPLHDRWIIAEGAALRLGTSLNGFGERRVSEISAMNDAAREEAEDFFDGVVQRRVREIKGRRLDYTSFWLC